MTAKSTPYLSCHRDNFPAKVPGPVAGCLRQVTQPPFIAGPLGLSLVSKYRDSQHAKAGMTFKSNLIYDSR
jgi:hypothetical protein